MFYHTLMGAKFGRKVKFMKITNLLILYELKQSSDFPIGFLSSRTLHLNRTKIDII